MTHGTVAGEPVLIELAGDVMVPEDRSRTLAA